MSQVTRGAESAGRSETARKVVLLGWAAKGVVYVALAYLVLQMAFGQASQDASTTGALRLIAQEAPGKIVLTPADDSDLPGVRDDFGKPLYTRAVIPGGTYPNLQPKGFFGGSEEVPTLGVRAALVTATAFIEAKPDAYDRFLSAVGQAAPSIRQRVGQ